mmetsp:Transcript_31679/g.72082  ORF Transcript_31679/g.72082 Transcript_31679/m.72082 type:complete len:234 (-) Transcript_31679:28-729(-)
MSARGVAEWRDEAEPFSEGSRLHRMGRCKPCAFFHTKGCQNGPACQFCHQCPPYEAQRRQRLRRQLMKPLFGHARQASDSSTTTASTAGGSSRRFSHSRQSSGASSCSTTAGEEAFATSPRAEAERSAASWGDGWHLAAQQSVGFPSGPMLGPALHATGTAQPAPPGSGSAACGTVQYILVPVPAPTQQQQDTAACPAVPAPWLPSEALPCKYGEEPASWDSGYDSPATAAGY